MKTRSKALDGAVERRKFFGGWFFLSAAKEEIPIEGASFLLLLFFGRAKKSKSLNGVINRGR
ncbi:hypothetical protein Q4Q34_10500 [Flavivirga abyssicola]|uniref:hypothetical protein n=1 Tax=Flavivirga abyssicola TaxID=3063533 RepID=UPI0026DEBCEB|nr:hypothetical protein [Flavivirga sp. MEBiC07777]WVK11655.1 hypothetical protein Q4Q34_10500 [Flavivirga sp. MEBiC07777]